MSLINLHYYSTQSIPSNKTNKIKQDKKTIHSLPNNQIPLLIPTSQNATHKVIPERVDRPLMPADPFLKGLLPRIPVINRPVAIPRHHIVFGRGDVGLDRSVEKVRVLEFRDRFVHLHVH